MKRQFCILFLFGLICYPASVFIFEQQADLFQAAGRIPRCHTRLAAVAGEATASCGLPPGCPRAHLLAAEPASLRAKAFCRSFLTAPVTQRAPILSPLACQNRQCSACWLAPLSAHLCARALLIGQQQVARTKFSDLAGAQGCARKHDWTANANRCRIGRAARRPGNNRRPLSAVRR